MNSKLKKVLDLKRELDERKKLYAEFDKALLELKDSGFVSEVIEGREYRLVDNFAESNTGWTAAAVKRYDLKDRKAK